MRGARIEVYRSRHVTGQPVWRWRLISNGRNIASGHSYSRRIDCVRSMENALGGTVIDGAFYRSFIPGTADPIPVEIIR